MIAENIDREAILDAIRQIDEEGVRKGRHSSKYFLKHEGSHYPPKYVISLANKKVNGKELEPIEFSGGKETNDFLRSCGFTIISKNKKDNC